MPYLIVLGAIGVYSGIGLAVRQRFFPREPVYTAAMWPLVLGMGKK